MKHWSLASQASQSEEGAGVDWNAQDTRAGPKSITDPRTQYAYYFIIRMIRINNNNNNNNNNITTMYINKGYDRYSYRRKFRSETSDNMGSWKAEVRRVRRDKIRRKKMQMREKVGKSRNTVFFQWFVAPAGRKVGSLKRRVRSQLARWEMKNCTPLWREAHFQVKMYKTHQLRTTFGSCDVEKVHAVVARITFSSQNVQNTPGPDHFWKLRCRKSARRCGAKHISKSKVLKTDGLGPLLEVQMSKKCRKSARRCGAKHIPKSKV